MSFGKSVHQRGEGSLGSASQFDQSGSGNQAVDGGIFDGTAEPGVSAAQDKDPAIAPNKFPHETGSDSYEGLPGDGKVAG